MTVAQGSRHCSQSSAEYIVWFVRVWGIVTALVLWGVGIEIAYDREIIGYYVIAVALLMSVLETIFLMHLLVAECHQELNKSCVSFWSCLLWLDDWRKGILYILLSVFCLIHDFVFIGEAWLAIIPGTMLVLAGLFYMLKTMTKSELHIPVATDNQENGYSRVNRNGGGEELGSGSIINDYPPTMADTISIQSGAALLSNEQAGSLAEQTEIMEA